MNAFILKIIAIITMFIDHLGYAVFKGKASYFNYIGRLSFPIFAFQVSEGYIHTHNVKKYLSRLLIFAIISQIPFMLFHSIINEEFSLNVIFTLLLGLITIIAYDKLHIAISLPVAIIIGIIAQVLKCDYGFYGVAIIFLFYICRKNKVLLASSFILATICNYAYYVLLYWENGLDIVKKAFDYYLPYAICTIFAIVPIILYNKKKGPNTKYLLYLFYPLHLLVIYAISLIY